MSLESQYQKLSDLEHILQKPDTYVGSVENASENMYI
jgi:DNA topoisomerase-2